MHPLKVTVIKRLRLRNLDESGSTTFRDNGQDHILAVGSEMESIGLNWAKLFMFEYWSHLRRTNSKYVSRVEPLLCDLCNVSKKFEYN